MLPKPRITEELELAEAIGIRRLSSKYLTYSPCARNILLFLSQKVGQGVKSPDLPKIEAELVVENKFPHTCSECSRSFKTEQGLNQHKGKLHSEDIKWKACFLCGKRFKHKYAVKFHVLQVHKKTTRTECPHCNNYFYNKYELNKHLIKKHKKDNLN